jgi:type III pantothenate kinase
MIAVDVGNARIKLGLFCQGSRGDALRPNALLPEPQETLRLDSRQPDFGPLAALLGPASAAGNAPAVPAQSWHIASVNRPAATRLIDWLRSERPQDPVTLLAAADVPLEVKLARPDMVGIDRLLDALAANVLRPPGRPAVVVDLGTAITVDLVSVAGQFLGGAIMPGMGMAARALAEFTDLLPRLDLSELAAPPPALGDCTVAAMRAGLFWGAVGAVRQLIDQLAGPAEPVVVVTGGDAATVAQLLPHQTLVVPHLTLAGIALAAG